MGDRHLDTTRNFNDSANKSSRPRYRPSWPGEQDEGRDFNDQTPSQARKSQRDPRSKSHNGPNDRYDYPYKNKSWVSDQYRAKDSTVNGVRPHDGDTARDINTGRVSGDVNWRPVGEVTPNTPMASYANEQSRQQANFNEQLRPDPLRMEIDTGPSGGDAGPSRRSQPSLQFKLHRKTSSHNTSKMREELPPGVKSDPRVPTATMLMRTGTQNVSNSGAPSRSNTDVPRLAEGVVNTERRPSGSNGHSDLALQRLKPEEITGLSMLAQFADTIEARILAKQRLLGEKLIIEKKRKELQAWSGIQGGAGDGLEDAELKEMRETMSKTEAEIKSIDESHNGILQRLGATIFSKQTSTADASTGADLEAVATIKRDVEELKLELEKQKADNDQQLLNKGDLAPSSATYRDAQQADVKDLRSEIHNIRSKVAQIDVQTAQHQSTLSRVDVAEKHLDAFEKRVDGVHDLVADLHKQMDTVQTRVLSRADQIGEALTVTKRGVEEQIQHTTKSLGFLEDSISKINKENQDLRIHSNQVKSAMSKAQEANITIRDEVKALTNRQTDGDISQISGHLHTITTDMAKIYERHDLVMHTSADLSDRLRGLTTELAEVHKQCDSTALTLVNSSGQLVKVLASTETVENEVARAMASVTAMKIDQQEKATEFDTRILKLETEMAGIKLNFGAADTTLKSIQASISNLDNKFQASTQSQMDRPELVSSTPTASALVPHISSTSPRNQADIFQQPPHSGWRTDSPMLKGQVPAFVSNPDVQTRISRLETFVNSHEERMNSLTIEPVYRAMLNQIAISYRYPGDVAKDLSALKSNMVVLTNRFDHIAKKIEHLHEISDDAQKKDISDKLRTIEKGMESINSSLLTIKSEVSTKVKEEINGTVQEITNDLVAQVNAGAQQVKAITGKELYAFGESLVRSKQDYDARLNIHFDKLCMIAERVGVLETDKNELWEIDKARRESANEIQNLKDQISKIPEVAERVEVLENDQKKLWENNKARQDLANNEIQNLKDEISKIRENHITTQGALTDDMQELHNRVLKLDMIKDPRTYATLAVPSTISPNARGHAPKSSSHKARDESPSFLAHSRTASSDFKNSPARPRARNQVAKRKRHVSSEDSASDTIIVSAKR